MPFRVTNASTSARLTSQIATSRQRLAVAQERVASGKRINRPSDDPAGAGAVIRLRTSQTELDQFTRNAGSANDALLVSDNTLNSYQQVLDRARALLTQGSADPAIPEARHAIAIEFDSLVEQIRTLANTRQGDQYVFGGTRTKAPPYDANNVPATTVAAPTTLQIEPDGTPIATGVTAETAFADTAGTVLETLKSVAAALHGTGNAAADQATLVGAATRLGTFSDLSNQARARIGEGLNHVTEVSDRLKQTLLSLEGSAQRIESADLAEAAVQLTESNTALEAILQSASKLGRTTLLDLLG